MFDFDYFLEVVPAIARSLDVTITLTLWSALLSLLIGTFVAVVAFYNVRVLNPLCKVYVSIFRGTPLLPQLFFAYFGMAYFFDFVKEMTPYTASAIVLSLNMGAYMSESIRGAICAVGRGQREAAAALGMNDLQIMFYVIIPQAVRIAVPSLFNNIIDLVKGSSVTFSVGVADIMGASKIEGALTSNYFAVYAAVMLIYWLLISALSLVQNRLERVYRLAF